MPPIRSVSMADCTSEDPCRRAVFVRTLGMGLEEHGFVVVENPGLPASLVPRAYAVAERLFALPEATKRACELPDIGRQRGYTPFGLEHAKDRSTADLKEFWQVGRSATRPGVPANAFPPTLPETAVFHELFTALERLADRLLGALGTYLGTDDGYFQGLTAGGNSVLRLIHYPPLPPDTQPGAVRAAAHEDINLMTVLPASTGGGLELLSHDGEWQRVHAPPDSVIVDTGDMMTLITGGRLPATTHRVVNPADPTLAAQPRYSMPFFVHPRPEAPLAAFDGPRDGPTAQEFLDERLRAIGVL